MKLLALIVALILGHLGVTGAACTQPTITSPSAVSDSTGTEIIFTWTTSVAADSQVAWGYVNAGNLSALADTTGVTSHSVTITGLFPSTVYGTGIITHPISGGTQCAEQYTAFWGGGDSSVTYVTTNAPPAGSADYYMGLNQSPQHVTQGYGVPIRLWNGVLVGTIGANVLKFVVTGLPNFVSLTWTDPQILGSGSQSVSTTTIANDTLTIHDFSLAAGELRIFTNVGGTTTPGAYTLTFTGSGAGLPGHTVTMPLTVDSVSAPFGIAFPYGTPTSYPAIPALSTYLASAATYGAYNCAQDLLSTGRTTTRANDTGLPTTSTTSVTAGTNTIATGPTTGYSSNLTYPLWLGFPAFGEESIGPGSWSVVDGTHLSITNAQSHTQPYAVRVDNLTPVGAFAQRGSWYYDGARVFYNIGDLLNDQVTYQVCVQNVNQVFRDGYIIPNAGSVQIFTGFTTGLLLDYQRQGSPTVDLTAINDQDSTTQPNYQGGGIVPVSYLQRETAYAFKFARDAVILGQNNPRFGQTSTFFRGYYLDHVLGHLDEICLSQNATYFENFMVGLEADALINYYISVIQDPRIPSAIKCVADYLWTNEWNVVSTDTNAFAYDSFRAAVNLNPVNGGASYFQDINNLISPMYAWLFKMTGSSTYQTEGDTIFNHGTLLDGPIGGPANEFGSNNGVPNGNSGKDFSQNYMWGPQYITFRSNPSGGASGSSISGVATGGTVIR